MPQSRAEVTLTGDWANTLGGESFVLGESGAEDKIILLGTQSNLHHLAEAEYFYVDGTFETCPRLFYQIFTIHITMEVQPDLPYGVCPASQQAVEYIQPYVHDGERSCTRSWSGSHPLLSSLWFRAGSHQCSLIELSNRWTQGLLLPLLPSNSAKGPGFGAARGVQIWGWNPQKLCAEEDGSHLLCSPQLCSSSVARLQQWNYYNYNGPRTNNHVEGWHSRSKRIVGKPHPNIFEIVDVIKKEQATTEMKLEQFAAGATQPPLKKRYIQWDEKICKLFERFQNGESSLAEYLASVRHQTGL